MGEINCQNCPAFMQSIFASLTPAQLIFLETNKNLRKFKPHETVSKVTQKMETGFCIKSGTIKIETHSPLSTPKILGIAGPSDVLCISTMIENDFSDVHLVTQTATHLCEIKRSAILQLLNENQNFNFKLINTFAQNLSQIRKRLISYMHLSIHARIAQAIIELLKIDGDLKWGRKDIAQYAGTTVETTIRILTQFEEKGLIKKSGRKIDISNMPGMLAIVKMGFKE